jgi:hypothetical protein
MSRAEFALTRNADFLHPGCLSAFFSSSPKGKFRIPANMQNLQSGQMQKMHSGVSADYCLQAIRQVLHSGLRAKIAFRLLAVYNVLGRGVLLIRSIYGDALVKDDSSSS